jgi:ankyrin repeat protein
MAHFESTPLGIACFRGDRDMCDVLLEAGAAVGTVAAEPGSNSPSAVRPFLTPLNICAMYCPKDVYFATKLLEAEAEANPVNNHLETTLYYAILRGGFQLADILLDHQANIKGHLTKASPRQKKTLVGLLAARFVLVVPSVVDVIPFPY